MLIGDGCSSRRNAAIAGDGSAGSGEFSCVCLSFPIGKIEADTAGIGTVFRRCEPSCVWLKWKSPRKLCGSIYKRRVARPNEFSCGLLLMSSARICVRISRS